MEGTVSEADARAGECARETVMIPSWVGVWTLSAVLSANSTAPRLYARGTRHIQSSGSAVTIVDDLVRLRGGVVHLEWTGKIDGRDYPVEGVEAFLTIAYTRIDDHSLVLTQKLDGRVLVKGTLVLSPDGQTITTTTTDGVTTATTVYSKHSS